MVFRWAVVRTSVTPLESPAFLTDAPERFWRLPLPSAFAWTVQRETSTVLVSMGREKYRNSSLFLWL